MNKKRATYELSQSPFYCLRKKINLASLLNLSFAQLKSLTQSENLYIERDRFDDKKGKMRHEEEPKPKLKQIHKRIENLLKRINQPDFLHSPAKGRSYISNARIHVSAKVVRSIDIKKYFSSASSKRVYWFFHKIMKCSPDVAGILKEITTFKNHLPTGSPLSPILSYYAYIDMWEAINRIAIQANCNLTVYVDDIIISGSNVPEKVIWSIKQEIRKYGLDYHKEKYYSPKHIPEVTGVMIKNGVMIPPNRHYKKMKELRRQISLEKNPETKLKLTKKLQGSQAQVNQVLKSNIV